MEELRQTIADLLGIDNSQSWDIADTRPEQGLYLLRLTPDADVAEYGAIDGLVIDVNAGVVIVRDFGYQPIALTDSLELKSYDEQYHLVDAFNPNISYDLDKSTYFQPHFDGIRVRIFRRGGVTYYSTETRFTLTNEIDQLYYQLGGRRDLYDESEEDSNIVYFFTLVDPSTQIGSKHPIGVGFILVDDYAMIDSNGDNQTLFDAEIQTSLRFEATEPYFLRNFNLSLDEVNEQLKSGFHEEKNYPDARINLGEAVTAYLYDEAGENIIGTMRIASTSYLWRYGMNRNLPDVLYSFYLLSNGRFLNFERSKLEEEAYLDRYPLLPEEYREFEYDENLSSSEDRLAHLFSLFRYALPDYYMSEGEEAYDHFMASIRVVTKVLVAAVQEGRIRPEFRNKREEDIINQAYQAAKEAFGETNKPYLDLVEETIEYTVVNEEGESLYQLRTRLLPFLD